MKCRVSSIATPAFACFLPVRCRKLWRVAAITIPLITLLIGAAPENSDAARISGLLTAYGSPTPLVSRDLHFQNVITGDVYLSPTHSDGSFRAILPPGKYRLRTETGAVLVNSILVEQADIDLGRINELAPLAPGRLWQSESIAPSRLASPAPSTAYVKTSDTTPLPAGAMAVPKPAFDWTRPPPETQASGPNAVTGMATAPLPPAHAPSATMPAMPGGMGAGPYPSSSAAARAPSPMP
ncbi:MAG: hypothetical protein JO166_04790 [Deltaproteobacteria bacterium]|nr:hypothetical protein [Deltaproteobacteria bacterium]